MFKVYYDYEYHCGKTTVYAVRQDYLNAIFLAYINNEWHWIIADYCKPCEEEDC